MNFNGSKDELNNNKKNREKIEVIKDSREFLNTNEEKKEARRQFLEKLVRERNEKNISNNSNHNNDQINHKFKDNNQIKNENIFNTDYKKENNHENIFDANHKNENYSEFNIDNKKENINIDNESNKEFNINDINNNDNIDKENKEDNNEEDKLDIKKKKGMSKPIKAIMRIGYIGAFLGITTPLVLFYGPYKETRKIFVSTLLATRHAYLLTDYVSEEKINNFMGVDTSTVEEETVSTVQNLDEIKIEETSETVINKYEIHADNFDGYILEISSPRNIKVGVTKYLNKYGQTTSEMAEDNDAIAAINGGSFLDISTDGVEYSGTGGTPGGIVIADGKVICPLDESAKDRLENVVAFTEEGKLIVGDHSLRELQDYNVKEALSFRGPNLIINGVVQKETRSEGINPRTAVGQRKDGTVIFLVIDGRKISKPGATIQDVKKVMQEQNVWNAGILDGGYSSTMYYKGKVINSPNSWNGERKVATTFYVK